MLFVFSNNSMQPHRRQPTRLPCPLDSPGKNTGVGCHFLLQCMKVKSESEKSKWSRSVVSDSLRLHGLQPTRLLRPWDSPGESTGEGCHCLLHLSILMVSNSKFYFLPTIWPHIRPASLTHLLILKGLWPMRISHSSMGHTPNLTSHRYRKSDFPGGAVSK